ncbi:MAG: hypothetical protein ACOYBQ_03005 [Fluviibacter sp.]
MFYSKFTGGFYTREIHGDNIPTDAVEITSEQHAALLEGQSQGKIISADENGYPILIDPPPLTAEQIQAAVTAARAAAYIAESDPLFFKANRGEATMEEWLAKIAEIKARFPDGELPVYPTTQ